MNLAHFQIDIARRGQTDKFENDTGEGVQAEGRCWGTQRASGDVRLESIIVSGAGVTRRCRNVGR